MENDREMELTRLLQHIQPEIARINMLLNAEMVSYEMIRGDIEAMEMKKAKLLEENRTIERQNVELRLQGQAELDSARKQAKEFLDAAIAKNVEMMKLFDDAKKLLQEADKRRLQEFKQKADRLIAA